MAARAGNTAPTAISVFGVAFDTRGISGVRRLVAKVLPIGPEANLEYKKHGEQG